jgi:ribose 5-phosphate isomerase A
MSPAASGIEKQRAAERAAGIVQSGMVLGLGTGTTAAAVVSRIASRIRSGELRDLLGVPTSKETARQARRLGVPITTLNRAPVIDLALDGADEVDDELNLLKGGGGALFREKMVAQASRKVVIVVDDGKCVDRLGRSRPVPVEVVAFARASVRRQLAAMGAAVDDRTGPDGALRKTDGGNRILDADFGPIRSPRRLAARLDRIAGIVAHGLFVREADEVIVASRFQIRHFFRKGPKPK